MLKSEKRESQKFKKRYGPRRHKMLGINKWTRKIKEIREEKERSGPRNISGCEAEAAF